MAPPEQPFPVSDLEQRIQYHTVNFKEKSRKLGGDFDLKRDCELLELVQYSCTTQEQQYERALASPTGTARMECFPFVRLFRKYACNKIPYVISGRVADVVAGVRKETKPFTSRLPLGRASMLGNHPRIRGQVLI